MEGKRRQDGTVSATRKCVAWCSDLCLTGGKKMKLREQMPELTGASKWLNSKPVSRADLIGENQH